VGCVCCAGGGGGLMSVTVPGELGWQELGLVSYGTYLFCLFDVFALHSKGGVEEEVKGLVFMLLASLKV